MNEDYATLCESCMPAGGCEVLTVAIMAGKCDRCGCKGKSPQLCAVRSRHLWPRPIPVTERLPEVHEFPVLAFGTIGDGRCKTSPIWWLAQQVNYDGQYSFRTWGGRERDPIDVTHWLPLPPEPQIDRGIAFRLKPQTEGCVNSDAFYGAAPGTVEIVPGRATP